MSRSKLAQCAAPLSPSVPTGHFPSELKAGVISFDSGFAFPPLLPDLGPAAARALSTYRAESLQYSHRYGLKALREWVAQFMCAGGAQVTADDLMLVNGAKHGIDLICRLLLDYGDSIVVTAPTYFTAIPIFRTFGVEFIEIPLDAHGLNVEELAQRLELRARAGQAPPKLIYDMPDFHNPTSITMPRERREELLALAKRHGIYVVEDSPYRIVRFDGVAVSSLRELDRDDAVIHLGTFSKLIAPGLRVGWINARHDLIARLMQLKADGGSSAFVQRTVAEFCASGGFEEHALKVLHTYRAHRDRMIDAVRKELPGAITPVPEGGYYVWVTLPAHVDGDVIAARASIEGVNLIPVSRFYATGAAGTSPEARARRHHMRLAYSFPTLEEIDRGVAKLGQIYRSLLA